MVKTEENSRNAEEIIIPLEEKIEEIFKMAHIKYLNY